MNAIKDHHKEKQNYVKRARFAFVMLFLLILVLLSRLAYLQIYHYEKYENLSKSNAIRLVPTPPPRGLIYDRNGVILAENIPGYSLDIVPEQAKNLKDTLERLSTLLEITPAEITQFHKKRKQRRVFSAIPLRTRLSESDMAKFSLNLAEFPGVEISAQLIRHYPYKEAFAHVVGYVGRISENELYKLDEALYEATTTIGKTGIEKQYEALLHGKPGFKQIEVDAHGKMIQALNETLPIPGADLTLTIDSRLQQRAIESMQNIPGATVAIDPQTGEVLAMVSNPSFDPNLFVSGISHSMYQYLQYDSNRALFNRVLTGQYPPASTVKPFLALAGLEKQVIDTEYSIDDKGVYQLHENGRVYRDWRPKGHGKTNLHKAIRESCDTYFYGLAQKLGINNISETLNQFGFGEATGIDLPGEKKGVVPSVRWKRKAFGTSWYKGETLSTGIGQGYTLVTPIQLATGVATIASEGTPIYPHLLKQTNVHTHAQSMNNSINKKTTFIAQPENWKIIKSAMEAVVRDPSGTAYRYYVNPRYHIAGKTGTAQIYTVKQEEKYDKETVAAHLRDHTLFMGFAPIEQPQIAVATILEHSPGSPKVTRDIIEGYLDHHAS